MKTAIASFVFAAAVLGAAGESAAESSAPSTAIATPTPVTSSIPTPSMSSTPVPATSSMRPTSAAVRVHCVGIGDGTFASVHVETRSATVSILSGVAPVALAPLPSSGGAGTLLLRDGELDTGYTSWLASGPQAKAQACELDVAVSPTAPRNRYALAGAVPVSIVSVPNAGANSALTLELRYTEIDLLGF